CQVLHLSGVISARPKSVSTKFELKNNDDVKFLNLEKILPCCSFEYISPEVCRFLSKIIAHSPNLTFLLINAAEKDSSIEYQLDRIVPAEWKQLKQINFLYLSLAGNDNYDLSVVIQFLSNVFPNLKTFEFHIDDQQLLDEMTVDLITDIQSHYKQLTVVKIGIRQQLLDDDETSDDDRNAAFEYWKKEFLNELEQATADIFLIDIDERGSLIFLL
ncbi:unnamed protein product, partial [Didymodactylos carnosus]